MRLADGPTVEVSLAIQASPAVVWPALTDIDLPARFSSEFLGGRWLDGTPSEAGARFTGRNQHPAVGEWETVCTVTEADPPKTFTYVVGDPAEPGTTWRYTLQPEGDGTRVVYWMRIGPGWSGINAAIDARPDKEERIIERRCDEHRANMLRTLEGLKGIVEGA